MRTVRERTLASRVFGDVKPSRRASLFCHLARSLAERRPQDVSWEEACSLGWGYRPVAGVALILVLVLLDEGLYDGPHKEPLRLWRPHIDRALAREDGRQLLALYLCGSHVDWVAADPAMAEFITTMFSKKLIDSAIALGEGAVNREMAYALKDAAVAFYGERGMPKQTHHQRAFFAYYAAKRPQEISWREECARFGGENGLRSYLLMLFVALLERGLYAQDHKEALERLKGPIKTLVAEGRTASIGAILCGDSVESLYALPLNIGADDPQRLNLVTLETGSDYLKEAVIDFLQSDETCTIRPSNAMVDVLLRSFGEQASGISRPEDFSASLFWRQAEFIRKKYAKEDELRAKQASLLRAFYVHLADSHSERGLFEKATSLSNELLHQRYLSTYISEGYLVTSFAPGIDLSDSERVVLILRGYDGLSTSIRAEDHIPLDLSSLRSPFYRQEALAYVCHSADRLYAATKHVSPICSVMQAILEAKRRKGYPNPRLEKISRAEAALIRKTVDRLDRHQGTKSGILNAVRNFFQWERDVRKRIEFEEFAIDYLLDVPSGVGKSEARAVPDEHLAQMALFLAEKSEESLEWALVEGVFHLLLQTEFRVGQILHLEVDSVRPTAKPNEFVIHSASKTSGGEKEDLVITRKTLGVLNGVIDATEGVRRRFEARRTSRYIFIYLNANSRLQVMTIGRLCHMLAVCCAELGIDPPYTANNLRDTHITKSIDFATDENGRVRPDAVVLTGHASLSTDYRHYVDVGVEKMIEATYDVYIGDLLQVDADGKVVEAIPEGARGRDRVVESGCGSCTAQYCSVVSPMPCLTCEHFVTTIDHEPYFVRAIEAVDAQLEQAGSLHDAEDLTTIKRLLAKYLAAIVKKKEEMPHGQPRAGV